MNFKDFFVEERARALAQVLLTRRDDLVVDETKKDTGLDFTVSVRREDHPGPRPFGVVIKSAMASASVDQANQQLKPTMASVRKSGPFAYPVCVFFFTAKDDKGYFTWVYEPEVTEAGDAKLKASLEADLRALNDASLDEIIRSVHHWYDAFFAAIVA